MKKQRKWGFQKIGITEHTHGFKEFKDLYYEELNFWIIVKTGNFPEKNGLSRKQKFVHTLDEYRDFIDKLKSKGYPVKFGIEVCNFKNQEKLRKYCLNMILTI